MKLKNQTIDLGLSGYDELFMTEQERADTRKPKVEELPLTELTPFKDHPFKAQRTKAQTPVHNTPIRIYCQTSLQLPNCRKRVISLSKSNIL